MKLLHVITSLRIGGAETLVASMLPRLCAAGVETADVALLDATPTHLTARLAEQGMGIIPLGEGKGALRSPRAIGRLKKLIPAYDIVHTHNTPAQFFTAIAASSLPAEKRPLMVTTEHNTSNRRRRLPFGRAIDRRMYSAYDAIVGCSPEVTEALTAHLDSPSLTARISTIVNGINLGPFVSLPQGLPGCRLLMVAAFRPQKRHDLVLRALHLLPEPFTLTLAGDGEGRRAVERLIASLGLSHRVTLAGNVSDIPSLIDRHDIMVYATRHEGLSLSMVEALASGRPLVCNAAPGVGSLTGDAALIVDSDTPEALADAIESVASSPELYSRLALLGSRRAAAFDIDLTTRLYLNLYNHLLNINH